jgi:hypothetical protein
MQLNRTNIELIDAKLFWSIIIIIRVAPQWDFVSSVNKSSIHSTWSKYPIITAGSLGNFHITLLVASPKFSATRDYFLSTSAPSATYPVAPGRLRRRIQWCLLLASKKWLWTIANLERDHDSPVYFKPSEDWKLLAHIILLGNYYFFRRWRCHNVQLSLCHRLNGLHIIVLLT